MSGTNIYGPVVTRGHLRRGLFALIDAWLPEYLEDVKRAEQYAAPVERPKSTTLAADLTKWPEAQLPALIFTCPGLADSGFERRGKGMQFASYVVALSAVVRGSDEEDTEALADIYGAALRMVFAQQGGDLGSFEGLGVEGFQLADEGYDDVVQRGRTRSLRIATVTAIITLRDVVSSAHGPADPATDPTDDPGPWPEATDTEIELDRRPINA